MRQSIALLPERSVLLVGGPQAEAFLQNLLTCDLRGLVPGEARYGALLTPQGKILFDAFVTPSAEGLLVDTASAGIDDLVRRLTLYRLRSKVEIAPRPELRVAALWGGEPAGLDGIAFPDPRYRDLGSRALAAEMDANTPADAYHARRIALGVADWDADMGSGELFPHEANLDQLHGVSFEKGCYVGQEVVSRMQHRGTGARSRILPVRFEQEAPPGGTDVLAGERRVGTLLSVAGPMALALLRLDKVAAAFEAGEDLTAGGRSLAVERPPWAGFEVPRRGAAA